MHDSRVDIRGKYTDMHIYTHPWSRDQSSKWVQMLQTDVLLSRVVVVIFPACLNLKTHSAHSKPAPELSSTVHQHKSAPGKTTSQPHALLHPAECKTEVIKQTKSTWNEEFELRIVIKSPYKYTERLNHPPLCLRSLSLVSLHLFCKRSGLLEAMNH